MAASTACATCSGWSGWPGITWSISCGIPGQLPAEWGGQLHRNLQSSKSKASLEVVITGRCEAFTFDV